MFALLGLSSAVSQAAFLIPDYTNSVQKVYFGVAILLIYIDQDLRVLEHAYMSSPVAPALPSWVPDWSDSRPLATPLSSDHFIAPKKRERSFCAARDTKVDRDNTFEGVKLRLRGHFFDKVVKLADPLMLAESPLDIAGVMERWSQEVGSTDQAVDTAVVDIGDPFAAAMSSMKGFMQGLTEDVGAVIAEASKLYGVLVQWDDLAMGNNGQHGRNEEEDRDMVYYRTLTADLSPEEIASDEAARTTLDTFKEWRGRLRIVLGELGSLETEEGEDSTSAGSLFGGLGRMAGLAARIRKLAPDLRKRELSLCMHRRLARCEYGHLCLGPEDMEVGDEIVILEGGRTPFVLRPVVAQKVEGDGAGSPEGEKKHWKIVGECYVHGIMYGEGYEEDKVRNVVLV